MNEPRALHLIVHREGGGTEKNVHLLCESTPSFAWLALQDLLGLPFRWSRFFEARRAIRAQRPDVIFCYGIRAHLFAVLAFPLGNPPLVGNVRGVVDFTGKKEILRKLIAWRFWEWVSNSRFALDGRPGTVIHNGVPEPSPHESPLLPDAKKPVFGMLANERPMKGHRWCLDLWKEIGKPGSLVFAGKLSGELRRDAESQGVQCPGYVESGPLLRSLDMLLLPSTSEGFPTVLLEAMARGVPCLANPAGGIPELIRHGENGYLLPREEWAGFLGGLDWDEARRLGEAAREEVRTAYSFEAMRTATLEVARRAASRH